MARAYARRSWSSLLVAIAAVVVFSACNGDSLSPFEPEVSSPTDNFQLQATNVTNLTTTATYSWANTGTRATVNHSTTTTAGAATIVVKDATGVTVYTKALSPSLNEATLAGQAGTWTIQLTLVGYSGTLNFRVQKL